ncbi:MAG: DUF928 domain-containing protein [Hydrococcus sp. Prado102]|jgi:hypothetical protein|nr:DUF928 domain-containing protein [Hydrococcus sp. Prado102]
MNRKHLRLLGIASTFLLVMLEQLTLAAARTEELSRMKLPHRPALEFKPPLRGAPGERKDSGSRDPSGCSAILAMVPSTNFGLTVSAYPTFWLYLPRLTMPGELTLTLLAEREDGEQEIAYRTKFKITQNSGIASFNLPQAAPPLEIGKQYRWVFSCGAIARYGEIKRIPLEPEIEYQLEQATPRERVLILAKNGLWYETLTELAKLRYAKPQDTQLAADWANLLQHRVVGLDELVEKPFLPCCHL